MVRHDIHHPHDSAFRHAMQDVRVARDYLEQHLPQIIQDRLRFETLRPTNATYIDDDLKQSASDIVYQVQAVSGDAYIYLLCEQQTSPQKYMPLRLLDYSVRIMKDHLKQGHKKMPLVIPVVLYNGTQSPYPYTNDFFDLFETPGDAQALMFKPFTLVDLSVIDDAVLMETRWAAFLQMVMKHIHQRDLVNALEKLAKSGNIQFLQANQGQSYLSSMLYYIYNTARLGDKQSFVDALKQTDDNWESVMKTIAEQLREEGMQRGMQRGMQEGAEQRSCEIAKALLLKGADIQLVLDATGISIGTLKAIQKTIMH